MAKKELEPMAKGDLVMWRGRSDRMTGLVLEVEDKRAKVQIPNVGQGWVKRESLVVIDDDAVFGG